MESLECAGVLLLQEEQITLQVPLVAHRLARHPEVRFHRCTTICHTSSGPQHPPYQPHTKQRTGTRSTATPAGDHNGDYMYINRKSQRVSTCTVSLKKHCTRVYICLYKMYVIHQKQKLLQ